MSKFEKIFNVILIIMAIFAPIIISLVVAIYYVVQGEVVLGCSLIFILLTCIFYNAVYIIPAVKKRLKKGESNETHND